MCQLSTDPRCCFLISLQNDKFFFLLIISKEKGQYKKPVYMDNANDPMLLCN